MWVPEQILWAPKQHVQIPELPTALAVSPKALVLCAPEWRLRGPDYFENLRISSLYFSAPISLVDSRAGLLPYRAVPLVLRTAIVAPSEFVGFRELSGSPTAGVGTIMANSDRGLLSSLCGIWHSPCALQNGVCGIQNGVLAPWSGSQVTLVGFRLASSRSPKQKLQGPEQCVRVPGPCFKFC